MLPTGRRNGESGLGCRGISNERAVTAVESGKLKNIIIIILLLLNLFLLLLVGGRRLEDAQSVESARQRAVEVLRASGVTVEDETVPHAIELRAAKAERDLAREQMLAAALLAGSVEVENRGGEVYRYTNANGHMQVHSTGEFWAQFEPGVYLLSDRQVREHGAAVLSRLEMDAVVLEDRVEQGSGSITFRQTVGGVPVLDCQVTLHYADGQLVRISDGRWVAGKPVFSGRVGEVTVATALVRLLNGMKELGDVYNRLDAITPAYTLEVTLSGPAQLNPVWHVRTDTGEYRLDLPSGAISRWDGVLAEAF